MISIKSSIFKLLALLVFVASVTSCQQYLDVKPDKSMATPSTLKDLQHLVNNLSDMNAGFPGQGLETSDDIWLTEANWGRLNEVERNRYCFIDVDISGGRWTSSYNTVVNSNIVLEGLAEIEEPSSASYNRAHLEGFARFFRAHAYFQLAQVYAKHYDEQTAGTDLGVVLRHGTAIDEPLSRVSVAETYAAIISDLEKAVRVLPQSVQTPNLPTKAAAFALLARTYLTIANYEEALHYADSALALHRVLIDFNELDTNVNAPFPRFFAETIFDSRLTSTMAPTNYAAIRPELLESYATDDLRRKLFFHRNNDGTYRFKGGFDGRNAASIFNGISTAELYLISAECLARSNRGAEALALMNELLGHRWQSGHFKPFTTDDTVDMLTFVLKERRKELVYRGLRWIDMRRLAKEGRLTKGVIRTLAGVTYELTVDEIPHYTYRLPRLAVEEGGYPQN